MPGETPMRSAKFKSFNYAIGMFGTSIPINMLKTYAAFFYVDSLGLKTSQFSLILLVYTFIDAIDIADVRNSLRATMQRLCGVVRTEAGLQEALQYIGNWSNLLFTRQFDSLEAWETKNMLVVARLVVEGALQRNETRGSHNRSDCEPFDPEEPALHSLFVNDDRF